MVIELLKGDITRIEVDVIVNAANTSLMGGGGVDGAIHRAGGKAILNECIAIRNRQGGCKTGKAVITTAGDLPAKKVIHTVGPVWNGGGKNEADLLRHCYTNALQLAQQHGYGSIAFPAISTGIYGFPKELACAIAVEAILAFNYTCIRKVIFICFDEENFRMYRQKLP